ncbi:MAG: hypothetical protein EOP50_06390 [Sphingobacteriales bacterium]|nr:MAG: hypothetical protein EOP50_06390 [Sphingobacteriales bacterium]
MVPMKCVGCGANLEIELDMGVFACAYCGARQQVIARGGTVSLKPVTEALRQVQHGTDRTAAELAMPRLERELAENVMAHKAALAKPVPIGNNGITTKGAWLLCIGIALTVVGAIAQGKSESISALGLGLGVVSLMLGGLLSYIGSKVRSKAQKQRLKASNDKINDHYGDKAEKIARQIKANRAILDAEHTTA